MKNRDVDDMYISILQALEERGKDSRHERGVPFTQLLGMVGAYFQYGIMYINRMEELGLISIDRDGSRAGRGEIKRCRIIEKGTYVLKMLEARQKMLGIEFAR